MELNNFTDVNTESTEELKAIEFGFDEASMGLMFKSFTDSLYSNKLGSIVREITSNAIDANQAAGTDKPVDIVLDRALYSGTFKLSFIDYGTGMSPDLIANTYSKYFASTKRSTNDQIGGWGIGAKTPLSYVTSFNLITHFEGIKYTYLVSRGQTAPEIILVNQEPTENVGTQVVIGIKPEDEPKLLQELQSQLRYFDSVNYHGLDGLTNDYQIHHFENFIIRPDATEQLEIALGKVAYPLDMYGFDGTPIFDQFGEDSPLKFISRNSRYDIQRAMRIALKFEVGELDVTLSRESLEYNDKTKAAIETKILAAFKEIEALMEANNQDFKDVEEVVEYVKRLDHTNNNNCNFIKLHDGRHYDFKYSTAPRKLAKFWPSKSEEGKYFHSGYLGDIRNYFLMEHYAVQKGKLTRSRSRKRYYSLEAFQKVFPTAYVRDKSIDSKMAIYLLNDGKGVDVEAGELYTVAFDYHTISGEHKEVLYEIASKLAEGHLKISDISISKEWSLLYRNKYLIKTNRPSGVTMHNVTTNTIGLVNLNKISTPLIVYGTSENIVALRSVAYNVSSYKVSVFSCKTEYLYDFKAMPNAVYIEDFNEVFEKSIVRAYWIGVYGDRIADIKQAKGFKMLLNCDRKFAQCIKVLDIFYLTPPRHIIQRVNWLDDKPIRDDIPDYTLLLDNYAYSIRDSLKYVLDLSDKYTSYFEVTDSKVFKFLNSNRKDE